MRKFDLEKFTAAFDKADDTVLNRILEEYNMSAEELVNDDGETLSLMAPFLKFMACTSPLDADVPDVDVIVKMAEKLDILNDVLCNRSIHSMDDIWRRALSLKSAGRRIL